MRAATEFEKGSTRNLKPENVKLFAKKKTFSKGDLEECLHVLANKSLKSGSPVFCACNYAGYYAMERLDSINCINGYIEIDGYTVTKYSPIYRDTV